MKMIFRTTPTKTIQPPTKSPTTILIFKQNSIESRWILGGNMIDRIRSSGEPCGSCGGR